MTDHNFDDDLINSAFDDFAYAAGPSVKITGTDAVRSTVRRRRTVQASAIGLLSAIVIAVPFVTYVSTHQSNGPPLTAAGPTGIPSASPASSASPTPSPSAVPSPSPSVSPTGAPATLPDGAWTPAQLAAAHIPVPKWHSPGIDGDAIDRFCDPFKTVEVPPAGGSVNREPNPTGIIWIIKTVSTNLDSDPAMETAALLSCQFGEAGEDMVVGYDRDAAGKPVMLGVIAQGVIWRMSARAGGGVTIDVSDMQACCSTPGEEEVHQTRSYAWSGSHFSQVSGPTSFYPHAHPAVLSISATSHGWGPIAGGTRTGTVTVTIKNTSSFTTNPIVITTNDSSSWLSGFGYGTVPGIAPGASATITFTLRAPTSTKANPPLLRFYEIGTDAVGSIGQTASYPLWK